MTDHIPARVLALAAQINDEPLAWNEHADGSIVIVFSNKGKHLFTPLPQGEGKGEGESPAPDPVIEIKKSKPKRQTNGNSNPR